ncbi:MAG: ABC transporter ATP-binding protein [Candidatus Helarchaeota archaeon]|nr:ABC transporter ATP-binding protein [Candidatus Helarchaeota archaeon]
MKDAIIQTFGLTKIFGRTIAVNKLDLRVTGGIYGFLGPNGAGKTTTIKMIIGSLFPTAGRIELFGEDISGKEKINLHKRVGYVPEHPTYFLGMTAEGLLDYIGSIFHMPKQEIQKKIADLLRLVNLTDARNRVIIKFSAGMKQRIGIAQALMNDPELLILDEITSNLDPLGRKQMIDLLKDLRKEGKTMFISTHILPEVQKMNADSIGIIDHGHLIMDGTIEALNKKIGKRLIRISPNHEVFRSALAPIVTKLTEDIDSLIVETDDKEMVWEKIAGLSLQNNIPLTEFRATGLEIEQIFMKAIESEQNQEGQKNV